MMTYNSSRQQTKQNEENLPVGDAKLVAELEGNHQLLEEGPRYILRQALTMRGCLVADDKFEHIAAGRILHDDCQVRRC